MVKSAHALPEVVELANEVGDFMEYWGFKQIHGRVWLHLVLSKDPLSATELQKRLQVSKALMSMTISDLLDYEVIYSIGKGPRGRTLFRPTENVMSAILNVVRRRELRLLTRIEGAYKLLDRLPKDEREKYGIETSKLKFLGDLIRTGSKAMEQFLECSYFDLAKIPQIP